MLDVIHKVTVKVFKARFSHYLVKMKEGYVFEVNGANIGVVSKVLEVKTRSENKEVELPKKIKKQKEENLCKCKKPARYNDKERFWCDECILKDKKVGGDYAKYKEAIKYMTKI